MSRIILRWCVLAYLAALLLIPLALVLVRALSDGVGAFVDAVTTPAAIHALVLTAEAAAIAVVCNTIFGIGCALVLVRGRSRWRPLLDAAIDLPFAVSPVVAGLALLLTYGAHGWLGSHLRDAGIQVIFAEPGIVLATIFVTVPFVVREVVPVLQEVGDEQEQAAATLGATGWQSFRMVTLPSIRWGVAYGVVLTSARALGEYGAVSVVSGRIQGKTETATIFVQQSFNRFDPVATYGMALVLGAIATAVLVLMTRVGEREDQT